MLLSVFPKLSSKIDLSIRVCEIHTPDKLFIILQIVNTKANYKNLDYLYLV
jgi:hypothetical protein